MAFLRSLKQSINCLKVDHNIVPKKENSRDEDVEINQVLSYTAIM